MKKIRAKFIKSDSLKFLSHLDILRTFNRAIRRSGVNIVYSQGFNPHPSMSFGLPLSVGVTSEGEYVDIDVEDDITSESFVETINKGLPDGLKVMDAQEVDSKSNIMALITNAKYKITIFSDDLKNIDEKIKLLLSKENILIEKETKKGTKEVDIKPSIREINIIKSSDKSADIFMHLDAGSQANLNPELVLRAMEKYCDIIIDDCQVHRLELLY